MSLIHKLLSPQEIEILQKMGLFNKIQILLSEIAKNPKKLSENATLIQNLLGKSGQNEIIWAPDYLAIERFLAWIKGETGYPIVDAAMKQLAQTGWMHNRSRMIVASILTKNLGVDWRWGQEYFRATLIDLDEASNNGGWQWASSTGSDPKPIRIFNPYLQAENYDQNNLYQKKWLPKNYQIKPIIEHKLAREQALIRYGVGGMVRDY
jgi:deoxyribodipyrimidine photolyase